MYGHAGARKRPEGDNTYTCVVTFGSVAMQWGLAAQKKAEEKNIDLYKTHVQKPSVTGCLVWWQWWMKVG